MSARQEMQNAAILELDAVVVGAGFAGLYMLHKVRELGLSATLFEAGSGVGGTWFWNRYPGARCDVDSLEYSFSFCEELQQEWSWSERFAAQPEILAYLNHVADRFDLRRDIKLETRVVSAVYDETRARWTVRTDRGDALSVRYCIMASGCLSEAREPEIPGLEKFEGAVYHTGRWPHGEVDFTGKRVGVVGTGSSGIQVAPMLARSAGHLYVFQRTPNFSIPARNTPTDPDRERQWKTVYPQKRREARETTAGILYEYNTTPALSVSEEQRRIDFEARWRTGGVNFIRTYCDIMLDKAANDTAAEFVRSRIREIVKDERTAENLLPRDHPIGAKRICIDTDYFDTYNRDNVTLVDIRSAPIEAMNSDGVQTKDAFYELDALVFATGFDAVTGSLAKIDIRGRSGRALSEKWAGGPRSYLGLMTAGFPNLFTITGPGSPSILTNVVVSIEQHVEWIGAAIAHLEANGFVAMDVDAEAEDAWVAHVDEVAHRTLFVLANSWYMGANIPGKPRVFMPYAGGFNVYRQKCEEIVARGYEGFTFDKCGTASHAPATLETSVS
jgi:cyclohexanone monooxygenase